MCALWTQTNTNNHFRMGLSNAPWT